MRVLTTILLFFLMVPGAVALQRVEITALSQVDGKAAYYVVRQDISGGTATLAAGSVLAFEGGTLKGCTLSGDFTVAAPEYQIFDAKTSVSGMRNATVPAAWFGSLDANNASATINRAIATGAFVTLGAGEYTLKSPILISDNQHFACNGTLRVNDDIPAVVMHGCYSDLDVYKIEGPKKGVGTGVLLCENTYNCNINVREFTNLSKGFDLTPTVLTYKSRTDKRDYAGCQYCRFAWQFIRNVVYGIYIDPFLDDDAGVSGAWVNENYFLGGRITADYGIYTRARNGRKKSDTLNGNVFENIGFEGINKNCIVLDGFWLDKFRDLRMSESLPKEGDYIVMNDCRYLDFDFKSAIPVKRINAQSECFGITMNGLFTDTGVDLNNNYNTLIVTCNPTDTTAKPLVLSTTKWTPRSQMGGYTCHKDETIQFVDIFPKASENRVVMSNFARFWIDDGKTLTIDMTGAVNTVGREADMTIQHMGRGTLRFSDNGKYTDITTPGFYTLRYFGYKLVISNLNDPTK